MKKTSWIANNWRPLSAMVYLLINLFDFVLAPVWYEAKRDKFADLVPIVKDLDPTVQVHILQPRSQWEPLTLQGGGTFHLSFGAILGAAAWTRGREKIEDSRNRSRSRSTDLDSDPIDNEDEPLPTRRRQPIIDNPDA